MKLTLEGIQHREDWAAAGIALPAYDVRALQERTKAGPRWLHFGAGNIFRAFLGCVADTLIGEGAMDTGIIAAEAWDVDIVDEIDRPHDSLALCVTLHASGQEDKRVIGSIAECIRARSDEPDQWARLKAVFCRAGLQMVSFTITEKGYQLRKTDGSWLEAVKGDMAAGPAAPTCAMAIVTALLLERYRQGGAPLALVSMDNCAQNGRLLQTAVTTIAREWVRGGFAGEDFIDWLEDERRVSFPWTMIDKITPRPSPAVETELRDLGLEDGGITVTSRRTYIAPFVNAEAPQYLVIEDRFPGGRPPLEKAPGVYLTDRDTVSRAERMKVTACLNPIHTALAPYGMLLGYTYFADLMSDPQLKQLAYRIGYGEGLPRVADPGIFSPEAFLREVLTERMPNRALGDTNARICTDSSQGVGVRFGETVKACVRESGTAAELEAIPLALAGWLRYFCAIDDEGKPFELAPDPLAEELHGIVSAIPLGRPEAVTDQLRGILGNEELFGIDLYKAGIGEKIEALFREEMAGKGAVRGTLEKYLKS